MIVHIWCISACEHLFACPSPLVSRSVTAEYKDYLLLLLMNKCVTVSVTVKNVLRSYTYLQLKHIVGDGRASVRFRHWREKVITEKL